MLSCLFAKRPSPRTVPCGPAGNRAYAIGDIHGRLDLLETLLVRIEADNSRRGPATTWLVFLGDLIDRGPDSREVIERLATRPPAFARPIFLKGNHEEVFQSLLEGDDNGLQTWLAYGGAECAQSYGLSMGWMLNATPAAILERLAAAVPRHHARFLADMADSFRFGDYLFVHAGIRPGIALEEQSSRDLRWIRAGFLDDRTDHGVIVVHGHSIVERPEEHPNRIAIDTGAFRSGMLTGVGIEQDERWFLSSEEGAAACWGTRHCA